MTDGISIQTDTLSSIPLDMADSVSVGVLLLQRELPVRRLHDADDLRQIYIRGHLFAVLTSRREADTFTENIQISCMLVHRQTASTDVVSFQWLDGHTYPFSRK